jgi:type I restriction enzyme M protein
MNAMLHDIEGDIVLADALSNKGKAFQEYDVMLTNPPFGTKQGGERPTRDDLTFPSSNKQLNFLQVIYRSLRKNGNARAAVVLPDNVLFQDGDGQKVRQDLMEKCNLHTVLRLPTGIFYAQGVKTNVLFFTRGKTDKGNTQEVAFYDLRTNMPSLGITNPLTEAHFKEFEETFHAPKNKKKKVERWSILSKKEIQAKGSSLDLGLIQDDSIISHDDLPQPMESAEVAIAKLEQAADLLQEVVKELQMCGVDE